MKTLIFVRSPYNYDTEKVSLETGIAIDGDDPLENLTQQHFKEEVDINNILDRFGVTGELPQDIRMPISRDFVESMDFQSAMDAVVAAKESFSSLDPKVRARFSNDPAEFVAFCDDPKNLDEAIRIGVVPPLPEAAPEAPPMRVRVVEDPAAGASGAPGGAK